MLPGTLIDRSFRERIILVGVIFPGISPEAVDEALDELAQLVDSAGADVVGRVVQRRNAPEPATFIGRGKAEEIAALSRTLDADTVVFDEELTPAQQRNLEKVFGRTAIDRTAVILDIFAQNARSPEGKAQVELALLRYRLPRLRGRGGDLSQQAGGIGTRGPGETQLEVDRRRLVRRMHRLEADLRDVDRTRSLQRRGRARGRHRELALVGYTNAGKSTLLNALTGAEVGVRDRLFHTLDPTTRTVGPIAGAGTANGNANGNGRAGRKYLVSDTVGFISKLPHQLVDAFGATLEETRRADLLAHVLDASAPELQAETMQHAVEQTLEEIGAGERPRLLVLNKIDLLDEQARDDLLLRYPDAMLVSGVTGEGLEALGARFEADLAHMLCPVELLVPYADGGSLAELHELAGDLTRRDTPEGVRVKALVPKRTAERFARFAVAS
jgi:GTPase